MKVTLILVGKTKEQHIEAVFEDYVLRIKRYAQFKVNVIKDAGHLAEPALILQKEAEIILNSLKENDYLVLLDENGKTFSSVSFADHIKKLEQRSIQHLVFLIGGAFGFDKTIYHRANEKISLSSMTFTHQMVRMIFAEQLYRAFTILGNQKYHH